jgi:hypothetical protein
MTTLSGDFITRVFEGSYGHAKDWMHEMKTAAEAAGHTAKHTFDLAGLMSSGSSSA